MDALKSPALRDDIELDPSAIGQFLHSDYVHRSTPNIYQLQQTASDSELTPPPSVTHSSTVHSFPNSHPPPSSVSTEQVRRKSRVPSTRSIKRQYIVSMAEAGDRPHRHRSSSTQNTRPSSSVSSMQGSPSLSAQTSATELTGTSPRKKGANTTSVISLGGGKKKKRKRGREKGTQSSAVSLSEVPMTAQLAKNPNQGVVVYDNGQYRKMRVGYVH